MPEEKKQPEETQEKKGGGKGLMVLGLFVVVIVAISAGAYLLLFQETEDPFLTEEKPLVASGPPEVFMLGDFVVNLAQPDQDTFLRMNLHLAVRGAPEYVSGVMEELESRRSQIRDIVMMIASGRRRADINSYEGRVSLKHEIIEVVDQQLELGRVDDVFFQEFVFQRL